MSTPECTEAVLSLIEQYSDIGIPEEHDQRDTFGRVLFEIGASALDFEEQHGKPNDDLVTAFEVISAAFSRVRDAEAD